MIVKLLAEHHLEFLSLKGGCRGSSESTHVKMPHCRKSHALAHIKLHINPLGSHLLSLKALTSHVYARIPQGRGKLELFTFQLSNPS